MRDSQSDPPIVAAGEAGHSRPCDAGLPDAQDRSYLLRRRTRYPFPRLFTERECIRLRRERRVSAPFSGIPPLSRDLHG